MNKTAISTIIKLALLIAVFLLMSEYVHKIFIFIEDYFSLNEAEMFNMYFIVFGFAGIVLLSMFISNRKKVKSE